MTGCQAELCASNVALPEHVRAGRTCSGKATLRTGRLAGWDTQHTSMSPPLLWRLGSCSASHTAVMVQAPARGLSAGLLLTHDAWHPHWTTLGPTPVKKDQEFARHGSAMVRLARGNAIGPSAERKPRIFHTVALIISYLYGAKSRPKENLHGESSDCTDLYSTVHNSHWALGGILYLLQIYSILQ